jgi:hypothetical protein
MSIAPDKANSPLLIDADRVLAFPVASQSLQLIAGRRSKNAKLRSGMQLEQLPQGHALEGTEALAVLVAKQLLGIPRSEAFESHVKHITSQVIRQTASSTIRLAKGNRLGLFHRFPQPHQIVSIPPTPCNLSTSATLVRICASPLE